MFRPFSHIENYDYSHGWDRYALDYEKLLVKDTVYHLTKEMMHRIVDLEINAGTEEFGVLDVNCGTGNDFPFFFDRGWHVTGCDGSRGMLNKAAENYVSHIKSGKLELYAGLLEDLSSESFKHGSFDLIFSVTGGFSYVDDQQLEKINKLLKYFLKDDGKMVVAHLNPLCLPEMAYRAIHLQNPFFRMKQKLNVNIKDEDHTMFLRSPGRLKNIYSKDFGHIKTYPLLALTPPYQTQFRPGKRLLGFFRKLERKVLTSSFFTGIADQVVVVCTK